MISVPVKIKEKSFNSTDSATELRYDYTIVANRSAHMSSVREITEVRSAFE